MANYSNLKNAIKSVIKANGNQEITGDILQNALLSIINILGTGYQFMGVATPDTNPGTPDAKVFYIANGKGTYNNFGGVEVTEDEVVILYYDTTWHKVATGIASQAKLTKLEKEVIYDVTANNSGATFASLSVLLSSDNLSTLIPSEVRCGGMSIRFVQNSDNKYVQARCIANEFTTDVTKWQGVDEEPAFGSKNLVESEGIKKGLVKFSSRIDGIIFNSSVVGNHIIPEGQLIAEGDVIEFNAHRTGETGGIAFCDSSNNVLSSVNFGDSTIEVSVAPTGYDHLESIWNANIAHLTIKNLSVIDVVTKNDIETEPSAGSTKIPTSGGVYKELKENSIKINGIIYDDSLTGNGRIPITDLISVGDTVILDAHTIGEAGGISLKNSSGQEIKRYDFGSQSSIQITIPNNYSYMESIWNANFSHLTIIDTSKIEVIKRNEILVQENGEDKIDSLKLSNNIITPIELYNNIPLVWIDGGYYGYKSQGNISFVEDNSYCYTQTTISVAGKYQLKCYSYYWDIASYVVYDSNNNVLFAGAKSGSGSKLWVEATLELPAGSKVCFSSRPYTSESADRDKMYIHQITSVDAYLNGNKLTPFSLTGVKWGAIGDSLTDHANANFKHYDDYIVEQTNVECYNYGVSGSGYKAKSGESKAFYQRALNVANNLDVITIFGSGNDAGEAELGTYTDTGTTTLAGCINTTIENLLSVNPLVRIGLITPTPWGSYNPKNTSGSGIWMRQYSDLICQIADYWGIPCLNLYLNSNLRPWDATQAEELYLGNGDTTHPNAEGHKRIASMIKAFVIKIAG